MSKQLQFSVIALAKHGVAVWPAFWTIGSGEWPYVSSHLVIAMRIINHSLTQTGEIDIIEGVHDNEHNQVTWHTGPGCTLNPNANFTGSIVVSGLCSASHCSAYLPQSEQDLDCDGTLPGNPGCGITEWSRASYGPSFDAQGGGVFAMKWDESGVAVCKCRLRCFLSSGTTSHVGHLGSFYRAAVPQDIVRGEPNPSLWGVPSAALDPADCDPMKYFVNHSIIFGMFAFFGFVLPSGYSTMSPRIRYHLLRYVHIQLVFFPHLMEQYQVTGLGTHTRHQAAPVHVLTVSWTHKTLTYAVIIPFCLWMMVERGLAECKLDHQHSPGLRKAECLR
jgi:hypothetical protein